MWRIIFADWRRLLWVQTIGWAVGLLLLVIIARALGRQCCLDAPERWPFILKVYMYAIAYAQSGVILWAQLGGSNIYRRQKLLATLPLSQTQLNLVHYLTGAVLLLCGVPMWIATVNVWRFYILPLEPWFFINVSLGIVIFLLLSMRNLFPRVLIPLVFAFVIVPGVEHLIRVPMALMRTPVATIVMVIATVLYGWWVAKRPTPRWAPGWGGRSHPKYGLHRSGS